MGKMCLRAALVLVVMSLTFCVSAPNNHPAYLHALEDLRAARWMIEHRPGNWARAVDEVEAVRQIDLAIGEIKQAAIDDGRNIDWHPPVDERADHSGRLHEAREFLNKAHADVAQEEDNLFAKGLRNRAIGHIDIATTSVNRALNE